MKGLTLFVVNILILNLGICSCLDSILQWVKNFGDDIAEGVDQILPFQSADVCQGKEEYTFFGYCKASNFPSERFYVTTQDGYILALDHIPHSDTGLQPTKGPVLLIHGFGCSSDVMVGNLDASLAFYLSRNGYDVWIGNLRGNRYSRNHTTLSPADPRFWRFSFQEHGQYDLPANIDFILQKTGKPKLFYVGYSMGGTSIFALLSDFPEYNDKLIGYVGLAPGFIIRYATAPLIYWLATSPFVDILSTACEYINGFELFQHNCVSERLVLSICTEFPQLCQMATDLIVGNVIWGITGNFTRLPVTLLQTPLAGMSLRQTCHYFQMGFADTFQHYDNGNELPLPYNLSNINVPSVMITGTNDALIGPLDVAITMTKIPKILYHVDVSMYTHGDHVVAMSNPTVSYPEFVKAFDAIQAAASK